MGASSLDAGRLVAEAFDGLNGWAIPTAARGTDADREDVERLYVLSSATWFRFSTIGTKMECPVGFVQKMKHALRVSGSFFTARRMLQEYVTNVLRACGRCGTRQAMIRRRLSWNRKTGNGERTSANTAS
jgi:hypothetical protein